MDPTAITVARAANLAKHGDNHKKEALGLQLLSRAIQKDSRLDFHKFFEQARADCCVYKPGAPALGIQLKTTGVNWVETRTRNEYYSFGDTNGYAGLLIVFVAIHTQPPRIWLAEGSKVVSTCVKIPVNRVHRSMKSDRVKEIELTTTANAIYEIYELALSGSSNYLLRSPTDHEKPTVRSVLAEYNAFKRLQLSLPVLFIDPPAEHMSYDYVVDGKKWQLKLARYCKKDNLYQVNCHKHAGRVDGKMIESQYAVEDFDFLCIQMPENAVDCCYVIPQGELADRRLIGDSTRSNGNIRLYPHRSVTAKNGWHTGGVHWTETYRIDFASDPLAKLACIVHTRLYEVRDSFVCQ